MELTFFDYAAAEPSADIQDDVLLSFTEPDLHDRVADWLAEAD